MWLLWLVSSVVGFLIGVQMIATFGADPEIWEIVIGVGLLMSSGAVMLTMAVVSLAREVEDIEDDFWNFK